MRRLFFAPSAALLAGWLFASAAAAQGSDEPIPYPDEDPYDVPTGRDRKPERSRRTYVPREETEIERRDRATSLAHLDDPTVGLAAEAIAGFILLESSRGSWVEPRLNLGTRFTWEFGRLFQEDSLREGLFLDVAWSYAGLRAGTLQIYGDTSYHFMTLAPAYAVPIGGSGSPFAIYFQVGGGVAYQHSVVHYGDEYMTTTGIKPTLQYGVGFRGRPLLSVDGSTRVTFRVELTRYRRQYMDDTFLGGSIGLGF